MPPIPGLCQPVKIIVTGLLQPALQAQTKVPGLRQPVRIKVTGLPQPPLQAQIIMTWLYQPILYTTAKSQSGLRQPT